MATPTPEERKMMEMFKKEDNNIIIDEVDERTPDRDTKNPYTRWIDWMPDRLWTFDKSDLMVLAGYPSCGKTEFTYFLARKNADKWMKVLYLSLELTSRDMRVRLARKKVWVSKKQFQEKTFDEKTREKMIWHYNYFKDYKNIKVVSYPQAPNIESIENTIRNHKEEWFDLFIIDNLWKIAGDENENTRFGDITSKLQELKKELNTCIMLLHHLSKPPRWNVNSPWWVGAIRWSQKVIDNSTLIFELFRNLDPDDYEDKSKVDLLLYKDTMDWAVGEVSLKFDQWEYFIYEKKQNAKRKSEIFDEEDIFWFEA